MTYQIKPLADQTTIELLPVNADLELAFLVAAEWAFLINLLRRATKQPIRSVKVALKSATEQKALSDLAGIGIDYGTMNAISFLNILNSHLSALMQACGTILNQN